MSRSRAPLYLGLGAAGGIGYYLYSAGGDTKVAEKKFESTSIVPFNTRSTRLVLESSDYDEPDGCFPIGSCSTSALVLDNPQGQLLCHS